VSTCEACPLCRSPATEPFFASTLGWRVRSDWSPQAGNVSIFRCGQCGHMFKDAATVRANSEYEAYDVFSTRADRDKVEFGEHATMTRSEAIAAYLSRHNAIDGSAVLDFGCHRGALLALLGAGHAGYDVSERYRPIIEGLGDAFYTPLRPPPQRAFGVLTLVHVLEHLVDIAVDLGPGLEALTPGGAIFVQVPNAITQPTDLYVADHRHHFTAETLNLALGQLGWRAVAGPESVVAGELSALYRRGAPDSSSAAGESTSDPLLERLRAGESTLQRCAADPGTCAVYGAGLLGSLMASVLGPKVEAFIDDNSALQGQTLLGRKVVALDALAPGLPVVVAVPPSVAARVSARARAAGHEVHCPFAELPARVLGS
jgi:hypothetical protein